MLTSARRVTGTLALVALLAGSVMVLAPGRAQAKTRDCTPSPGANLAGCDYANADLSSADFSGSNLRGANLNGANLNATNFTNANLRFANLQGAGMVFDCNTVPCPAIGNGFLSYLYEVNPNFTNANLHAANLEAARLGGTVFSQQLCLPHQPCITTTETYPDAILTGVKSGGITGTPASLPSEWELIDGYLAPIIAPPQITTTSLPAGTVGSPYSTGLTASGGNPPYTWSVTGSLPPGLVLHRKAGTITGKPQAPGTSSFTVVVTDSKTAAPPHTQRTATRPLSITVQ
jgi:hypothetical protein